MKKQTARQIAADRLRSKDLVNEDNAWRTRMKKERENEADARATGALTSQNRPFLDRHAIAGAGGDPEKDEAILQGTYFGKEEYRPNFYNEPRPEEQVSRDFTPAWDTTYGGPYERKPDPRPDELKMRKGGAGEAIATSMANDFAAMDWMDRQRARRAQDAEREGIVRQRAESTNPGRDKARPPRMYRDVK